MANRVTQVAVEVLIRSTNSARVTQQASEALVQGARSVRVTQQAAEVLIPNAGTARVTQAGIEAVIHTNSNTRVTQAGIESIIRTNSNARVTQAGIEALVRATSSALITQAGIEVIVSARKRYILAQASFYAQFARPIPATAWFLQTFQRDLVARASLSQAQARPIPVSAIFLQTFARTLTASASIGTIRTVLAFASIGTQPRNVPASARIGSNDRVVPANAVFIGRFGRIVFASAEIGYRRYVPAHAIFLGYPRRSVPAFASFAVHGHVPATASFWFPAHTWNIPSDAQARVMSLASHLVNGSVGIRFGLPSANNAPLINNPPLANFDQYYYDDTFWPHPVLRGGQVFVPFDEPSPAVFEMTFNWAWPNETNDYAGGANTPGFGLDLYRREFGLPNNVGIVAATSGQVEISIQLGVFDAEIMMVRMNGFNLPFGGYTFGAGEVDNIFGINFGEAARGGIWEVPSSTLRPGSNVLVIETETELTFGLFGRMTAFLLSLNYNPARPNAPQVIG